MIAVRTYLRRGLGLALLLAISSGAVARAEDKVEPTGEWNLTISTPDGGALEVLVVLKKDGDDLKGTMTGSDAVESDLTDVTFEDGELAFKLSRDFGGTQLESSFKGKLTADAFDGNVDYDVGGQTGTAKVDGKRVVAAISAKGTWKFAITTDDGQAMEPIVKIEQDGESVTGTFQSLDGTEVKLEEGRCKDNELCFKVTLDFGGQELIASFTGKLDSSGYKGTVDYDIGGQTGTLDVNGARVEEKVSLAGLWELVATADAGTFEPKLHLKHDGDKLEGLYIWSDGVEANIENVKIDGKSLAFKVEHDLGGEKVVVEYSVTIDGDALAGSADYDLSGQTGTAKIEGKRAKAADVAGTWKIALTTDDGQSFDVTAKFERDGESLKGTYSGPAGDADISDIQVDGDKVKFKVVRERDGQEIVVEYSGQIEGDAIKGKADFDLAGQTGTFTFEGKRQ